jgi:hypothetical protein
MICFSHSDDTRYQDEHLMAIMQFLARLRANGARILMPAYAIHSKKTYESYKQNYNLPLFFFVPENQHKWDGNGGLDAYKYRCS